MIETPQSIKIFYSYSHSDEALRKKLDDHLAFLKRDSVITWYDREIIVGHELNEAIQKELNEADIILLLVSSSFLSSFYCYDIEMKRAMERHQAKEAVVVPILLSDCVWQNAPFAKLLMTPYDAKPINNPKHWATIDEAFTNVAKELERTVNWVKENKASQQNDLVKGPVLASTFESKLIDYPKPSRLFTGREKNLLLFNEAFGKYNLIAVEGLGGIGKTEFVAKCIQQFIPDKSKIIWMNGGAESKFDVFVESAGYGYVLKGENKTPLAKYSGFKDVLERDERIIFWDNFQAIKDPEFVGFIDFAHKYLSNAKFVFITKQEISIGDAIIKAVPLIGLEADAINYAKKLRGLNKKFENISDLELENLCKHTAGHPLAIQLCISLMSKGLPSSKLIEGIIEYKELKEIEQLIKRLFTEIYNHPTTSEDEKRLLQKFSVYTEKVSDDAFKKIFGKEDFFIPRAGLIDKFLITNDDGFYESHPLIRAFSYELLNDKESTHANAAEYYINQRTYELSPGLEEQIHYHLAKSGQWDRIEKEIENKGRQFILLGQFSLVKELLDNLKRAGIEKPIFDILYGDISQNLGKRDEAKRHFEKAHKQNEDKKVRAEGLIKYGEILYRNGELKASFPYFKEALQFSSDNNLLKEKGRSLNDIGMLYSEWGELELSEKLLNEALVVGQENGDDQGVADTLLNLGDVYSHSSFQKAIKFNKEGFNVYEAIQDKVGMMNSLNHESSYFRDSGDANQALKAIERAISIGERSANKEAYAAIINGKGLTLMRKGKLEEALVLFQQSQKINEEIKDNLGIAGAICNIAEVYRLKKELDKSLELYKEGVELSEKTGFNRSLAAQKGNMAVLLDDRGEFAESLKLHLEALILKDELGDKYGIFITSKNIAGIYSNDKVKKYPEALYYLFRCISIGKLINMKLDDAYSLITHIRDNILKIEQFKKIAYEEYSKIDEELKPLIPLKELCKEPITVEHKLQRNDLCYCGSGKKFKNCHGRNH